MPSKKVKPIYVITTMRIGFKYGNNTRSKDGIYHSYLKRTSPSQKKYLTIIRKRTWGWYPDLEQAQEALEKNYGDMFEGEYQYGVIEEVPFGVMWGGGDTKEVWYKWKGSWEEGQYLPCDKPDEYKNVICFMERMRRIRADWSGIHED